MPRMPSSKREIMSPSPICCTRSNADFSRRGCTFVYVKSSVHEGLSHMDPDVLFWRLVCRQHCKDVVIVAICFSKAQILCSFDDDLFGRNFAVQQHECFVEEIFQGHGIVITFLTKQRGTHAWWDDLDHAHRSVGKLKAQAFSEQMNCRLCGAVGNG